MWHLGNAAGDTVSTPLQLFAVDLFYDHPLNKEKGTALTVYAAYHSMDFGPGYVRNLGGMNPASGVNASGTFNGAGNAFPAIGTGNIYYAQAGFLLPKGWLPANGALQLVAGSQVSDFNRLHGLAAMYEGGVNWSIHGTHGAKMNLNYQSRPIFETQSDGSISQSTRKGMVYLQFQVAF